MRLPAEILDPVDPPGGSFDVVITPVFEGVPATAVTLTIAEAPVAQMDLVESTGRTSVGVDEAVTVTVDRAINSGGGNEPRVRRLLDMMRD